MIIRILISMLLWLNAINCLATTLYHYVDTNGQMHFTSQAKPGVSVLDRIRVNDAPVISRHQLKKQLNMSPQARSPLPTTHTASTHISDQTVYSHNDKSFSQLETKVAAEIQAADTHYHQVLSLLRTIKARQVADNKACQEKAKHAHGVYICQREPLKDVQLAAEKAKRHLDTLKNELHLLQQ